MVRDLTLKDCKGLEVKSDNPMDILAAVAEKALEKYEEEKKDRTRRVSNKQSESSKNARKKRRKESSWTMSTTFEVGESSTREHAVADHVPQLPEKYTREVEEMARGRHVLDMRMVMEKELTKTDVDPDQNRLLIPLKKIIGDGFLKEDEKTFISGKHEGGRKKCLNVRIIEPLLDKNRGDSVKFGKMDMDKENGKSSLNYAMNGNWRRIVSRNKLEQGMKLQVWCFRIGRELCFALVALPKPSKKIALSEL